VRQILNYQGVEVLKEGQELLAEEALRSIGFLVNVRDGNVEGKSLNHRIVAAKILIDKVFPSGGEKGEKGEKTVRIEVVDLTAPLPKKGKGGKI